MSDGTTKVKQRRYVRKIPSTPPMVTLMTETERTVFTAALLDEGILHTLAPYISANIAFSKQKNNELVTEAKRNYRRIWRNEVKRMTDDIMSKHASPEEKARDVKRLHMSYGYKQDPILEVTPAMERIMKNWNRNRRLLVMNYVWKKRVIPILKEFIPHEDVEITIKRR